MPASQAKSGYNTKFAVQDPSNANAYFELDEVNGVTPPNFQADQVEVTHLQSPNRQKEFIQGMIDPGDMTLAMNYIVGSDTDDFILAWRTAGDNRTCKITYPDGEIDTFPAFVKGYAVDQIQAGSKMGATLTLKVAGDVTRA